MKKIKYKILFITATILEKLVAFAGFKFKEDGRPQCDFPVVYFMGKRGITPLNASLHSIYKNWKELPEIKIIVSDDTPGEYILGKMGKWPRKVTIVPWQECAAYFKSLGNDNLDHYAAHELWGKKFAGIQYLCKDERILYTDTDVLWFHNPKPSFPDTKAPYLMLGQEVSEACYSEPLVEFLKEDAYQKPPMNSGVTFAQGTFSHYPKWDVLCDFLAKHPDNRTEQTAFAIFTNLWGRPWNMDEIMIGVEDLTEIIPKRYVEDYKKIYARHYVNTKPWTFWRDYILFIRFKK